ncbi:MAG: AtpZ/AtpI family protein [Lachnospiraceae bacterium]|nr:AtpZ/AtpI family protein [Lachnospiraceae bacterium]
MLNNLTLIGQLGLSLVVPVILCIMGCFFLVSHGLTGSWIYIPGFILGIGASFMTAYKFYLYATKGKHMKKKTERKGVYFNRHI